MPRAVPVFLIIVLIALSVCQRVAAPLPHEAYIWQRVWTPALRDALQTSRASFAAYRVLAAETDRAGSLVAAAPDLHALAASGAPVTAVLRLNGSDPPPDAQALNTHIARLAQDWREAGVALNGVEIDHDCATARLPAYAALLAAVRKDLPARLRLSITALPAWTSSAALRDVLAVADESVLQVHAVRDPARGLFDARTARRWIADYARVSPKSFRVAVPAYGVRAEFDVDGHALQVSAETLRDASGADARELQADPSDVSTLLRALEHERPTQLVGVLWFRLPSADDRRAWSLATLRAVIAGDPPAASFSGRAQRAGGATDLVLANTGAIDAREPAVRVRASACSAADGANGFEAQARTDGWRFAAPAAAMLRAGRERRIGWVHCGNVEKVEIDETP